MNGVHPDRIAACLRTVGAAGLPNVLLTEPRFAARLSGIVAEHYALEDVCPETAGNADHVIAALSLEELQTLARRAGIVIHAREFLREIRGPVLAALGERFGASAIEDARRHGDLALDRPQCVDMDELAQAVDADGLSCLAAWIAALPELTQKRVRLKWPDDDAVPATGDTDILQAGPTIIRQLASSMEADR